VSWTWRLETADGTPLADSVIEPVPAHSTQSDAESWLGENWRGLVEQGAAQASLIFDSKLVYGPMALRE
jgi:hypothetical protein